MSLRFVFLLNIKIDLLVFGNTILQGGLFEKNKCLSLSVKVTLANFVKFEVIVFCHQQ